MNLSKLLSYVAICTAFFSQFAFCHLLYLDTSHPTSLRTIITQDSPAPSPKDAPTDAFIKDDPLTPQSNDVTEHDLYTVSEAYNTFHSEFCKSIATVTVYFGKKNPSAISHTNNPFIALPTNEPCKIISQKIINIVAEHVISFLRSKNFEQQLHLNVTLWIECPSCTSSKGFFYCENIPYVITYTTQGTTSKYSLYASSEYNDF